MTRLKYFLLGAVAVAATGAYAGPSILAALPYGGGCTAISNVALSTSSETVFAADPGRKEFCVTNNDASIAIYLALHATATSADVRIPAGGSYCAEINGGWAYEGVVDALAASGTPAISGYSCK